MIANPYRGEVSLVMDGRERRLRLTLGALAALESRLGEASLPKLIERFGAENFCAEDIIAVLDAGLYGGGERGVSASACVIEGGAKAAALAAISLLREGFG